MDRARPEVMYDEQERAHYDRLDEAAEREELAIKLIDADPEEIPALVSEEMLLDCVREIFKTVDHSTVSKWKAIMRDAAIEWQIKRL